MPSNEIDIDHGKLQRDLRDVGDYLAELRYIDLAQQHIVQRNHEYAADGTASGTNLIQVRLGTQYPFMSQAIMAPTTVSPESELRHFEVLAEQARQWATNEMAFLNHLIREIMHYPIHGYALMDGNLQSVWNTLETRVEDDFGYLDGQLSDWEGTAADEFKSLFYKKQAPARLNQQYLITALQGALEVSRRIVEYSQQSVINAVTAAREVLLEELYLRSVDGGGALPKSALIVVAGAATVLASVVGMTSLWGAVTLESVAFAAGTAASELPANLSDEREIGGGSAEEIYVSLLDAIREVNRFFIKELDYLHDDLRGLRETIEELRADHLILPKRPLLVDGVSGEEFYHDSSKQYPLAGR